jgi:anti-sigma factor RsiW
MSKPSDLELMMYFDGELEAERRDVVAKYLAESSEAATKVRALGLGGEMVARLATRSTAADAIADGVMNAIAKAGPRDVELMMYLDDELEPERREVVEAHLASSRAARVKLDGLRLGGEMLFQRAVRANAADGIAGQVMAVIAKEAADGDARGVSAKVVTLSKKPASNDNSRRIYAIAAFAVAAAAALLVWGRGDQPTTASMPAPTVEVAPSAEAVATNPAPTVTAVASAAGPEDESSDPVPIHGVEVAAVEFGQKMGSIFYVPTGENGSVNTTTVVWLAEETGEE